MTNKSLVHDICRPSKQNEAFIPKIRHQFYQILLPIYLSLHRPSGISVEEAAEQYEKALTLYTTTLSMYYHFEELKAEHFLFIHQLYIWNLCKVLYFKSDLQNMREALMKWYCDCNKFACNEYPSSVIRTHPDGSLKHADFWPCALELTLFDQRNQLAKLFESATSPKQYFTDLMHQLASYLQSGYTKDQLCTMLNTLESADYLHPAVYHDASALKLILTILTGDKYAIMKHARDRPHAFILYYRYNQEYTDTINSEDVFKAAKEFYSQMPIEEPDIIQHLLMGDIYNVLNICTEGDWWFLAHLADLLALRKLVPETMTAKLNDLSISIPTGEYFMLYFASYLVNRFGMWKEGFDYLLLCGEYGKEVVIEHLKNIHLNKSDDELDQIATYCTKSGLGKELGLDVYKAKTTECMNSKDYKRVIDLKKKAGLEDEVDSIFYQMILDYATTGEMYDLSLLGKQEPTTLFHTVCYYLWQMSTAWEEKRFSSGYSALKKLLDLRDVPSNVCLTIILEASKLAQSSEVDFKEEELLKVKKMWQYVNSERTPDMLPHLDSTAVLFARLLH